ncbi:MAG TPA: hypothetical protein VMG12_09795 [Polyangiaceae bacterium]|nr:hypothetical protein [Polyangiaceae bacterium]
MTQGRTATGGDAAWQRAQGTASPVAEGVVCGSCGAHTPVYGAGDPTCVYCDMPVDLPSNVQGRAAKLERRLEKTREVQDEFESWLTTSGVGYIKLIIVLQLTGLCLGLVAWMQLMDRAQREPTPLHWLLIASCFYGPCLLWVVAQHRRFDAEVLKAAKLSFAQLEVAEQSTGIEMRLSCTSCGGALDAARIRGLTIRCTQCKNALLAPSRLVNAGQKSLLRKAVALRRRLQRGSDLRTAISVAGGLLYMGTFASMALARGIFADELTAWLMASFLWVFGLSIVWNFTHSHSGWERVGIAFALSAIALAGAMGQVLVYLEKMGLTQQ